MQRSSRIFGRNAANVYAYAEIRETGDWEEDDD
jgi:hypothetical protein